MMDEKKMQRMKEFFDKHFTKITPESQETTASAEITSQPVIPIQKSSRISQLQNNLNLDAILQAQQNGVTSRTSYTHQEHSEDEDSNEPKQEKFFLNGIFEAVNTKLHHVEKDESTLSKAHEERNSETYDFRSLLRQAPKEGPKSAPVQSSFKDTLEERKSNLKKV